MRRNQKFFLFLCVFPIPMFVYRAMNSSEHCCMSSNKDSNPYRLAQKKHFNMEEELNLNYVDEYVLSNFSVDSNYKDKVSINN